MCTRARVSVYFLLNYTADVLDKVIKLCVAGAKIIDICIAGDKAILEATSLVYNKKGKKKISKGNNNNILYCGWEIDLSFFFFLINIGIGFPTTVSVNNCVAHFSPLPSDPESEATLKEGDVAKM